MAFVESFGNNRIKIYIDRDDIIDYMEDYIQFLTQNQNNRILIKKDTVD